MTDISSAIFDPGWQQTLGIGYGDLRLLEERVPSMRRKGRVQATADADLTIFNPETVVDRATYRETARHSEGIRWVLVGGVPVVAEGELRTDVSPGQPIRAGRE